MSEKIYAAHIAEDKAIHLLEEHLAKVGDRAEAFAAFRIGGVGQISRALARSWQIFCTFPEDDI